MMIFSHMFDFSDELIVNKLGKMHTVRSMD